MTGEERDEQRHKRAQRIATKRQRDGRKVNRPTR
jgi:hypothetical protein